ncbi:MAG: HupE/UreJ family protein [Pseudomonadota bacterium]|nr:HupE/UreJ family protein [Pseudomonadota bacterium]
MRRRVFFVALLAASGTASAHGSIQGIDHFSAGLLHPLVEPTHLISLVALALMIGQRGIARAESALLGFAAGVLIGLCCAALGWIFDAELALLVLATLTGGAVAMSLALPAFAYAVVAAAFGAGVGMGSNPDAFHGGALLAALSGAGIGASLCLLGIASVVNSLKKPWLLVLVRVVGSWTSASSILVLALWLSGKHLQAPADAPPPGAAVKMDTTR